MTYLYNLLLIPLYYFVTYHFFPEKLARKCFFLIVIIHAVLFRALSNPYDYVDTLGYAEAFGIISEMSFKEAVLSVNYFTGWGQGYVTLNWLIGQWTDNPIFLFVVLATVSVGGVILYYYKTSYTPLLSVLFYLLYPMMYYQGFGVVRQHLAIVFVLWALYYMRNLKIAVPLSIIGVLCHPTAIVVVPFFFIRNFNMSTFNSLKLMVFSIVGFFVAGFGASFLVSMSSRYGDILETEGEQNNIVPVGVLGAVLISCFLTGRMKKIKNDRELFVIRFLIYGFVIALFGTTVPRAGRLSLYFIYAVPVAFSLLYKYTNRDTKWIFVMCTISLFLVVFYLMSKMMSRYEVYHFFWEVSSR